jgi:manganese/zinc/iron transport system ATP- binding protein
MDAVVAENLTVVYERVRALEDVSFRIPRGSMTAVIGPNGSGKSTLLKACIGLVKPVSGRISVLGWM